MRGNGSIEQQSPILPTWEKGADDPLTIGALVILV